MLRKLMKGCAAAIVLACACAAVWFGAMPRMARFQAYEGRIREAYRIRVFERELSGGRHGEAYLYDYYLRFLTDDGRKLDIKIPYRMWQEAGVGQRIAKRWGERWPEFIEFTDEDKRFALDEGWVEPEPDMSEAKSGNADEGRAFLDANAKKEGVVVLPSGLQYKVLREGDGPHPAATDTVRVHYRGRLVDGTVFDSSYDRGESTAFRVNQVIRGWTEALQLMSPGAKWEIYVPSELAYGHNAPPAIGPDQTLIFEVELLEVVR